MAHEAHSADGKPNDFFLNWLNTKRELTLESGLRLWYVIVIKQSKRSGLQLCLPRQICFSAYYVWIESSDSFSCVLTDFYIGGMYKI